MTSTSLCSFFPITLACSQTLKPTYSRWHYLLLQCSNPNIQNVRNFHSTVSGFKWSYLSVLFLRKHCWLYGSLFCFTVNLKMANKAFKYEGGASSEINHVKICLSGLLWSEKQPCAASRYRGTGLRRLLIRLVSLLCFSKLVLLLFVLLFHTSTLMKVSVW